MSIILPFAAATEASFVETSPGYWTVSLGHESRVITRPAPGKYIAWIGHQSVHWCFSRALKACTDDIEYRLFEAAEAQRLHDEAIASLMRMTPAQRNRLISNLETERDGLDYSESHVDAVARKASIDRKIVRLREWRDAR
jgi:hypothetical protein